MESKGAIMDRCLPWTVLWTALILNGAAVLSAAEGSPEPAAAPAAEPSTPAPMPTPMPAPTPAPAPDKPAEPSSTELSERPSPPAAAPVATDVPVPSPAAPEKPAAVAEAPAVESAVKTVPSAAGQPTAEAPESAEAVSTSGADDGAWPPRPLSVAPQGTVGRVTYDRERRPAWVESAPVRFGETHATAVASGPWLTAVEARQALDAKLLAAAREYAAETVGHAPDAHRLTDSIDLAFVKSQLVDSEHQYEETLIGELSGSTHQAHALLQFSSTYRQELAARWKAIVLELRMARAAAIGGLILSVVAALYALLRIDTATRGYYTRSLQFVGGLAILGLVAAGIMLARSIPWL